MLGMLLTSHPFKLFVSRVEVLNCNVVFALYSNDPFEYFYTVLLCRVDNNDGLHIGTTAFTPILHELFPLTVLVAF